MLLTLDVGNTQITLGAFRGSDLRHSGRLKTDRRYTADELGIHLLAFMNLWKLDPRTLEGVCIASVVPPLDSPLMDACRQYLQATVLFVGPQTKLGIKNRYKKPEEVGADRLVNAVAVHALHRKAVIVVDFGTATTFDCVTARGDYLGGIIAPGLQIAMEALGEKTAKLPKVAFAVSQTLMGRTTKESLQSGLFWGYISLVEGLLTRLKREMRASPVIVLTGGLSPVIGPHLGVKAQILPDLTLEGLRLIWDLNQSHKV